MKNRQKIILIAGLVLVIILVLGGLMVTFNDQKVGSKINILLIGVDNQNPEWMGNTDSITILSIDKNTKKVSVLSIPRDTRVDISGHGMDKINAAYPLGGIKLTTSTIEKFLKVHIDYYMVLNFWEFKSLVDTLGGIDMNVEPHIAAYRPQLSSVETRLNGDQTLLYARFRQDNEGDLGRVKRHEKIIDAIVKESLKPANYPKIPSILSDLSKNLHTNIPVYDTVILNKFLNGFSLDNAPTAIISGNGTYINGIYYLIPDLNKKEKMVVELGLRG